MVVSKKQPKDLVGVAGPMDSPVERPVLQLENRNTEVEDRVRGLGG